MIEVDVDVVKLIVMPVEVELFLKGVEPFSIEAVVDVVVVDVVVDVFVDVVTDVVVIVVIFVVVLEVVVGGIFEVDV